MMALSNLPLSLNIMIKQFWMIEDLKFYKKKKATRCLKMTSMFSVPNLQIFTISVSVCVDGKKYPNYSPDVYKYRNCGINSKRW